MPQEKLTDEEKQILTGFYKENPILWNNADPNNRNKIQRSLVKVKLATLFDDKYSEEFLE